MMRSIPYIETLDPKASPGTAEDDSSCQSDRKREKERRKYRNI